METDQKVLLICDQTSQSLQNLLYQATEIIGLNRVDLNGGDPNRNRFGLYDGWPGRYWIDRAQTVHR